VLFCPCCHAYDDLVCLIHPSKHVRHPCPCFSNIGLDVSHAPMVAMINACHVFHQNVKLIHGCKDCMYYFVILRQAFNKCFDPVILFIHFSLSFEGKMPWYVVYRGRIPSTSRNVYINDLSLMTPKILVIEQAHSMTKYLCSSQLTSDAGQAQRMVMKCLVWS
jgi:hypothetical protein